MHPSLVALYRHMLIQEAQASIALDNDSHAQTFSLEDLTPEQQRKYEARDASK